MVRRLVIVALLASVTLACHRSKSYVVVAVDVDRVARESKQARQLVGEVESFARSLESQLNQAAAEIDAARADPRVDPRRIEAMSTRWDDLRRQAEEQVGLRRDEAVKQIHRRLAEASGSLARELGWDLVIRKDPRSALWVGEALDETDMVVRRMDDAPLATASAGP